MNSIQPFTAYAPFMTVDGNHERDWPASGKHPGPPKYQPLLEITKAQPDEALVRLVSSARLT